MSEAPNPVKAALRDGELQIGLWLVMGSPQVAELVAQAGFDWAVIDAEHGVSTATNMLAQLQALERTGCTAVVRVAANDPVHLKQALDLGATCVLVPMVDDVAAAEAAVAACRYPPAGIRGMAAGITRASRWGAVADYTETADDRICVIVQAESAAAMAQVGAIAAVDGVDAVFIGPTDLAADMGHAADPGHPDVRTAIEDGIEAIRAAGAAAGIFTLSPGEIADYGQMGVTLLAVGADTWTLRVALTALSGHARAAVDG